MDPIVSILGRVRTSTKLIINFDTERIAAIRDTSEQRVPLLRLEPLRLGSIFATHHEDRLLVEPDAIPVLLIDTLQAIEDRKFDRHHGLDFAAIVRAAWVNLRHGEIRQGGSTLTQQLVKSYFLDRRKTFGRKIREAIMAVALVQVVERGTGRPAKNTLPENMIVAGKTGTSDEFRDSWFAGFGNDYLAVVWVGRDDNQPIGLTGSAGALTIWAPVIAGIDHSTSYYSSLASSLKRVWIDYQTGLATRQGCGESVRVPIPSDVRLKRLPGCVSGLGELGARALDWLDKIGKRP